MGRPVSISNIFKRRSGHVAPPPVTVSNPYRVMSKKNVELAMIEALEKDNIATLDLIYESRPTMANWMIEAEGSGIGDQPITTPAVFYAVAGSGKSLQWMMDRGADLRAEGNFSIGPVAAFAASKGKSDMVETILQRLRIDDMPATMGSLNFDGLGAVMRHYGYAEAAAAFDKRTSRPPTPPRVLTTPWSVLDV